MGLDSVELAMEVEDEFSIRLSDAECEQVRTVADIAALVISKLPRADGACPSARGFYQLRRQVMSLTGKARGDIRPTAPLEQLFPSRDRRRQWMALRTGDQYVPALALCGRIDGMLLTISGVLSFAWFVASLLAALQYGWLFGAGVCLAGYLLGCLVVKRLSAVLASEFPCGCATFGDLVRASLPLEVPSAAAEQLALHHRVMETVRRLTANQLGLPLEEVKPESRLVDDLGMD